MRGAARILGGIVAAAVLALGVDRLILAPMRVDRAQAALPRVPLGQVLDGVDSLDAVVFLDDRDGWFLIDGPARAADLPLGLFDPGAPHVPVYCGGDRGHILWAVRAARIVGEVAVCDLGRMDLAALREVALPMRMERDLLTGPEVAILAAEVAQDPDRVPITLPAEPGDLPLERVVVLPWLWSGPDLAGDAGPDGSTGANLIAEALAGHAGAFEIEAQPRTVPDASLPGGGRAPVLTVGGEAVVVEGLARVIRPVFRVRCTQEACAGLDGLEPGDSLDVFRDRAVLDAALAAARPAPLAPAGEPPPDRATLLDDTVAISPAGEVRHAVRIARRLTDPAGTE